MFETESAGPHHSQSGLSGGKVLSSMKDLPPGTRFGSPPSSSHADGIAALLYWRPAERKKIASGAGRTRVARSKGERRTPAIVNNRRISTRSAQP